jgi:hypothetical protein
LGQEYATVDHRKEQYVVGAVHTQTIEGFWSLIKRGCVGTFYKVSKKVPAFVCSGMFSSAIIIDTMRTSSEWRLRDADDIQVTIATVTSSSSMKISRTNLIGDVFSAVTS